MASKNFDALDRAAAPPAKAGTPNRRSFRLQPVLGAACGPNEDCCLVHLPDCFNEQIRGKSILIQRLLLDNQSCVGEF
jgi:hypothetical protein